MPRLIPRRRLRRKFGWKPNPEDKRDRKFDVDAMGLAGAKLSAVVDEPIDFRPDCPAVISQANTNSCVGQVVKAAFEVGEIKAGLSHIPLSALHPYYHSRRTIQARGPLLDFGSHIRQAAKIARKLGVPPEHEWPFSDRFWTVNRRPPPRVDISGFDRSGAEFFNILDHGDVRVEAIVAALQAGFTVIFGTPVSTEFQGDGSAVIGVESLEAPMAGRHAMLIVGVRQGDSGLEFLVRNSWGDLWRDGGYAWLTEEYIRWGMLGDLTVFRGWRALGKAA